jgi:5,10-methenyltetrahydromethanopterin hydrogenase
MMSRYLELTSGARGMIILMHPRMLGVSDDFRSLIFRWDKSGILSTRDVCKEIYGCAMPLTLANDSLLYDQNGKKLPLVGMSGWRQAQRDTRSA